MDLDILFSLKLGYVPKIIKPQFFRGVAQRFSALAWGARGRVFKSRRPDFIFKVPTEQITI